MPRRSNLFQEVVATLYSHMAAKGEIVEQSAMLINSATRRRREVDVVITGKLAGEPLCIAVEAKSSKRPLDVEWVEKMLGKHKNLPTDKLILVSESGFTQQALDLADSSRISTISPENFGDGDREYGIVNRVPSLWPKSISLKLPDDAVKVRAARPGGKVAIFSAPRNLDIHADGGSYLGDIEELLTAALSTQWAGFAEHLNLRNISERTEIPFTITLEGPWKITIEPYVNQWICLQYAANGGDREYHKLTGVQLSGSALIDVQRINLKHMKLGEMAFSFGQGYIQGRPALIVVSEDGNQGKLTFRPLGELLT
ncbi:restriction endonuclease [Nonomuraea fuscirosea]|uniref:restriction endonuclease n=1 Tax=Nonomuraea fuscirosea TaxID=1291556 RepID=UPI0033D61EC0